MSAPALPTSPATTGAPHRESLSCDVCPHPLAGHDPIGLRFCQATLAGALTRGCVCRHDSGSATARS
jgi:hypothetical protein